MSRRSLTRHIPSPLKAIIYARVSLDMTGEGASVARQIEACRSLAAARGYQVVMVETDTQSAFADKARPGWERVKAAILAGEVDVVVAWQLDRITRSLKELEQLIEVTERTDVPVVTVSGELDLTTSSGRLIARILGAVARAESELKSARLRLANRDRAHRGVPRRDIRPMFGYDHDRNVIEPEARAIRRAARDVLAGTATTRTIRDRWNAAGLFPHPQLNPSGWSTQGIRGLLLNPKLAGLSTYHGEVVGKGSWRPILRVQTHEALLVALECHHRPRRYRGSTPQTLLEQIAFCQRCGSQHMPQMGPRGLIYRCKNRHAHVYADRADAYVRALLIETVAIQLSLSAVEVARVYDDASLDQQRAMIADTFIIGVTPGTRYGRRAPVPERVRLEVKTPGGWAQLLSPPTSVP